MIKLDKQATKAVLAIYGYVGGWSLNSDNVNFLIDEITKEGYKQIDLHIHTYGGMVFDGNLIYNFLANFNGEVDIYIDGVCASMGAVIMLAATRIHIAENGFIMVHAPSGGVFGNAKDFVQQAKLLRSMEKNFIAKLVERTGKSETEVATWMDGTDYWFSADEAITEKLADDKFSAKAITKSDLTSTEASQMGAQALFNCYALTQNMNLTIDTDMNKKDLIARYGLTTVTEANTDEEVMAALDAKIKASDDAAQAALQASIKAEVAQAHKEGKITEAQMAKYETMGAKLGVDDLKAVFAGMNTYTPITAQIVGGGKTTPNTEMSWDEYQAKAPEKLEALQKSDPEAFKALFKAKYGVEPEV